MTPNSAWENGYLWQVCAEPVLAHFHTFASLGEANLALEVHCVLIGVHSDDLVDGAVGETWVVEAQGRNEVGGTEPALYWADLSYT